MKRLLWFSLLISAAVSVVVTCSRAAMAWGVHADLGTASANALSKDDPVWIYLGYDPKAIGQCSWMGDWAMGDQTAGVRGLSFRARDFLLMPGISRCPGHTLEHAREQIGPWYRRTIQAMRTESPDNAVGWLGTLLHYAEDIGAACHAHYVAGPLHVAMDNWVDRSKIDIAGYKPRLLGTTVEQSEAGLMRRLEELQTYSAARFFPMKPLIEANDRPAVEAINLECALESARVAADILHTLGYIVSHLPDEPNAGGLTGTVTATPAAGSERLTAKIMLLGTNYSTLADSDGRYVFRNLPAGTYRMAVMRAGSRPTFADATVTAGTDTTFDLALRPAACIDNLLRNEDLSVRWIDPQPPDGWEIRQTSTAGSVPTFTAVSERIAVKPGQRFRVTIEPKEGATVTPEVELVGADWKAAPPQFDATDPHVFTVPDTGRYLRLRIVTGPMSPCDALNFAGLSRIDQN